MKRKLVVSFMFLLCAGFTVPANSALADSGKQSATEVQANDKAKSPAKNVKSEKSQSAKTKPVDINTAGKAELAKLPGISEADAEKIIAGRPYLSKANLVTHNIISRGAYDGIKSLIVAKQNKATEAKVKELEKAAKGK